MTPAEIVRPRAYSYVRFSSAEQAAGDSLRRQTQKAEEYAAKHGLILDDKLNIRDLGVSAFRGANVAMGALGDFLSLVQHGDIPKGSYLLAENIDRISRDVITEAMTTLTMLINSGITLVTLGDGRSYSRESINQSPFVIMEPIMGFIRANDESKRKQELLRAAWHGKRLKLKDGGKPMTKLCPSWLRLKDDRSGYEVIEGRAEVVRRIFDTTLAGVGQNAIAATLNREGVPVFGSGDRWHGAYLHKVLRNEAVVGRFTPRRREHGPDGKSIRPTAGETIEGYYPAVVDTETWERVRSMNSGRTTYATKGAALANILAGLSVCPKCGGTMTRVNKGSEKKRGKPYLVCIRAKTGAGCVYKAAPLHQIEDAIVEKAEEFLATMPSEDAHLEEEWQRLLNSEVGHEEAISNTIDAIKAHGHSQALLGTLRQLEADRDEIKRKLIEVGEKAIAATTNRTKNTLDKLVEGLKAEPRDIPAINATMKQLFDRVEIDWPSGRLWFHWRHAPGEMTGITYDYGFTKEEGTFTAADYQK